MLERTSTGLHGGVIGGWQQPPHDPRPGAGPPEDPLAGDLASRLRRDADTKVRVRVLEVGTEGGARRCARRVQPARAAAGDRVSDRTEAQGVPEDACEGHQVRQQVSVLFCFEMK